MPPSVQLRLKTAVIGSGMPTLGCGGVTAACAVFRLVVARLIESTLVVADEASSSPAMAVKLAVKVEAGSTAPAVVKLATAHPWASVTGDALPTHGGLFGLASNVKLMVRFGSGALPKFRVKRAH